MRRGLRRERRGVGVRRGSEVFFFSGGGGGFEKLKMIYVDEQEPVGGN